ncbi:MAG: hypothetical protein KDD03_04115 [Gelidibacter sp.]|nr:hypothetical protein [Gelidibacter sp.]
MGKYRRLVMASILGLYFQKSQAQQSFAKIEKNVNVRAKDLYHDLNKTKDTLILKSEKNIDFVYSINEKYRREIDFEIEGDDHIVRVPLHKLSKGKHTFVVGQSPLKIIFVVRVFKDDTSLALLTDPNIKTVSNED